MKQKSWIKLDYRNVRNISQIALIRAPKSIQKSREKKSFEISIKNKRKENDVFLFKISISMII